MRDFNNIRILPLDYGPRTHPDGIEGGPDKRRTVPYVDPPTQIAQTRLELDLKSLQRRRFAQITEQKLFIQPYKTYFRDLMLEQKRRKKIEAALKAELEAKQIRDKLENEVKAENSSAPNTDKTEAVPTMADIRNLLSTNASSFKLSSMVKEIKVVKKFPAPGSKVANKLGSESEKKIVSATVSQTKSKSNGNDSSQLLSKVSSNSSIESKFRIQMNKAITKSSDNNNTIVVQSQNAKK